MAYKFQLGAARLSGSTTFEEPLVGESSISAASLSSSAGLQVGGTVQIHGVADAAADVTADKFYILDATDGLMKSEDIGDLMASVAGAGLGELNDQLKVNVDDSTIEINSDIVRLKDSGVVTAKIADDAVTPAKMSLFDDSLAATDTHILIADGTDYSSFAMTGDATLSNAGVLSIGATKVTDAMLNDDVAAGLAGDGLAASAGVLEVQVSGALKVASDKLGLSGSIAGNGLAFAGGADSLSELLLDNHSQGGITNNVAGSGQAGVSFEFMSEAVVAVADDFFMFADGGITGSVKKESIADFMTAVAGDGLAASSGVLAVGVDDSTVELNSDALRVKATGITEAHLNTSVAGDGLSGGGGSALALDLNELTAADVDAGADSIAIIDATDNSSKKESIADLAIAMAGNGIGPNAGTFDLDLNELTAAAVNVAADSIAIIDADDSNGSKKESIADLVAAMAGAGLTDTDGVLSVTGNNVALKADGGTLAEGYNYFADVSAAATVTLPASPSVGDVVTVKARAGVSATNYIKISKAGSQTIDGETEVRIESPYGAVSMVYVASNDWRII